MNTNNKLLLTKKGFTLIELLVVIAIIGLLSAVILAALTTARDKGNDAAIKSDFDAVRTQSVVYFNDNANYGTNNNSINTSCLSTAVMYGDTTFSGYANINAALLAANKVAGGTGAYDQLTCLTGPKGSNYVLYAPLKRPSTGKTGWCIDSTGFAGEDTAPDPLSASKCP